MTTLQLKRDKNINVALWEEFYAFKWKQKIKGEVRIRISILLAIIFLIIFFLIQHPIFLIAACCAVTMIIYSAIQFFSQRNRTVNTVRQSKITDVEFSFSEKGIRYKFLNAETYLEWPYYKFYEMNGATIYLYDTTGKRVIDIITERILGKDAYIEIRDLILTHIPKK